MKELTNSKRSTKTMLRQNTKITSIKSLFTLIAFLIVTTNAWAQNPNYQGDTWYSLYETGERTLNTIDSETLNTFTPVGTNLTFDAKRAATGQGTLKVAPIVNGQQQSDIFNQRPGKVTKKNFLGIESEVDYTDAPYSATVSNPNSNQIKFYTVTGATLKKYFKNVKLPLAKHILINNGTSIGTTSLDAGNQTSLATSVNKTSDNAYTIPLRSFYTTSGKITITSSNEDFHFSDGSTTKTVNLPTTNFCASAGYSGSPRDNWKNISNYQEKIYFTPSVNIKGYRSTTITISDGTNEATLTLSAPVIPTFYFKATTVATEGNVAVKASFEKDSYSQNSPIIGVIASSTSAQQLTTTAYYYAPKNEGNYHFQGWYATSECTGERLSTEQTIERTITSSSLDPSNPTETKYYAKYNQVITAEFYGEGQEMKVGDTYDGISYIRTSEEFASNSMSDGFWYSIENNEPQGITKGSDNPSQVISYDPSTKRVTAHNAGTATLVLRQEAVGYYVAVEKRYTYTITKHANGLRCTGDTWSKTMTFDQTIETVLTANNADYANTPIQIAQTDGDTIAQYVSGSVNSFHNEGTATWKVWQEEDYKYEAADKILTVNVGTAESPDCSIYLFSYTGNEMSVSEFGESRAIWSKVGVAKTLYFEGRRSWGDLDASIVPYQKIDGNWHSLASVKGSLNDQHPSAPFYRDLNPNATAIKFERDGGVNTVYIQNVYVTSLRYFYIKDATDAEIDAITMPTNTIGGNATTAEFYIDYSTCAEEIKLHCSHPHITFDNGATTTQFDSNGSGKQKITLSYSSDKVEDITATITIYTPYEHKTITITAKTEKEKQELIWQDGYNGNPITLPVSLKTDNAAVASSGLQVIYSTDPTGVIKIADDGKSFEIIAEGTATLTATQAGNETFLPVTETKTVNAVDKKIQYIVWNQDFTRGLHVDDLITLNACAYVMNIKDSTIVLSDERTALIQYSCPANNGVISIVDGKITIIGYGETTITATLAGDEKHFAATSVTKKVYVRQYNDGECENIPVFLKDDEIEFFAFDLTTPKIVKDIKLDRTQGVPDKLNFYVRGVSYNVVIQYYRYGIDVYQSTDNGNSWGEKIGSVWPEKNTTLYSDSIYSDSIQLSPDATHIRFVRPDNAWGYHYVGGVVVSRLQFIETENELIDLGNVAAGAVREGKIRFNYSDVKKDLQVTKEIDSQINKLDLDKTTIEVECGATDKDSIAFTFKPMQVGEWTDKVTITDPKTGKSKTVTLKATVTIGTQQIIWNPETNIKQNTPPQLDAVATSGLPVTYEVTSGTDVATIQDGQVIIHKTGTFTITASQAGNNSFNKAADLPITFTVSEYEQFIFETDGEWTTTTNWNKKQLPGENNDVIINANVTIIGDVVVNSMIINDTVIVKGKLTIKNNSSEGNSDLIIHAELGDNNKSASSGQVIGAEKLKIKDAYFQMTFDPSGQITYGWYDFVVPFEVNITDGIFRQGETKPLRNGVDFIVMQHSEAACAAGQKDWKTYTGIMYPGKAYTITFDDEVTQNTFLFKKRSEASLINSNTLNAEYTQSGQEKNRGWNGFGNGTLQHKQLQSTGTKVQIYDHTNNVYRTKEADKYVFAVGTSFFVQTNQQQQIILADADADRPILAPAREGRTIDEFRLALTAENENNANDYMWVSASENANGTYTIGHDLLKKGTPTDAKLAQMWTTRENIRLCDIEMQLINEQAQCTIDFFAPQTKQYTLHVEKAPKDANLYLTYNNQIIWNLTASPYNLDLNKGTTTGYGLLLEANRAPQITTGTEQTITDEQNTARKILINNQIYLITPDGAIYTMMGTKIQ